MIVYRKGDATRPVEDGKLILAHVCNNRGGWGRGFVLSLSRKWKLPEQKYRQIKNYELGAVQFVGVSEITVANMIAQDGYGGVAIRYDSLRICLGKVREHALKTSASVIGPKFGCELAGGKWEIIEKIIEEELCSHNVKVAIYEQTN